MSRLQIEHFPIGVFVYQLSYTKKILKLFYMDRAHIFSSPMVIHSLDMKNDSFHPCENGEELCGPEVPYFKTIGTLMYLTNYIRADIVFLVNLLAMYNSAQTIRHWNGIKHIALSS